MKKTFNFGKIAFYGNRKINLVELVVELKNCGGEETFVYDKLGNKQITGYTPEYLEFSVYGKVWNRLKTDIICGGQCLDTIAEYKDQLQDIEVFNTLYELWKKYHLNGSHAGTPEQEKTIKAWEQQGNKYEYKAVCEMLKQKGLYEVNYTGVGVGKMYNNEPYKYGHGWLVEEIPSDVLLKIEHLLSV